MISNLTAATVGRCVGGIALAQVGQGQGSHGLGHFGHERHLAPGRHLPQPLNLQAFEVGVRIRP